MMLFGGRVHRFSRKIVNRFCEAKFSTVPLKSALENVKLEDIPSLDEGSALKQLHHDYFSCNDASNLLNVRSGAYVEVPLDALTKFVPEGLNGDIKDEFKFSHKNMWMIRDTSKLVCKIIDHFETTLRSPTKSDNLVSQSVQQSLPVSHTEYINRPEWETARLKCSVFGKDVGSDNLDDINKYFEGKPIPNKIMLTGPRGAGKSTVLCQAVYHARSKGWLCLYIPNGWDHVQSGPYIEPVLGKVKVYDNPIMSTEALRGFWMAHKEQLKQLPIQNIAALEKYKPVLEEFRESWNRALSLQGRSELGFIEMRSIIKGDDHYGEDDSKDSQLLKKFDFLKFSPKTLEDYVLLGVALPEVAGAAFADLVAELRELETFRVLFVVDQYNTWRVNSAFSYEYEPVSGHQIAVPHALKFFGDNRNETENWKIKNGLCIAATSFKHIEGNKVTFENSKHLLPLRIRVPVYNQLEYLSAVSYYINNSAIDPTITLEDYLEYRMFSGSNPKLIRIESIPFFFPRSVWANRQEFRQQMLNSLSNGSSSEEDSTNIDDDEDFDDDDVSDDGSQDSDSKDRPKKPVKSAKK